MIEGIDGAEEWMAEWRKSDDGRVGLGRSVAGVKEKVLVRILLWEMFKWSERRKYLLFGT